MSAAQPPAAAAHGHSLHAVRCTALARYRARRAAPARAIHAGTAAPLATALCTYLPADDYLFILVLIGDSGVGKSCLLLRFAVRAACVFAKNWLRPGALCCLLGLTRAFSGGAGR